MKRCYKFNLSGVLFVTGILCAFFLTSCGKGDKKSDSVLPEGNYTFYGSIDNSDNIVMDINVGNDGKIEGGYNPVSDANNRYSVQGSVFDKNKVTLYITKNGSNDPVQTFNIFAEKGDNDVITMKGTMNDNQKQQICNVTLTTDKSLLSDVKAPSVPQAVAQAPAESSIKEVKKPEKPKIVNGSPYPIAPGRHTFNGKAEGQWPIVVYLNVSSSGSVSGKMAYKSTLKKYGDTPDHYMQLHGYFSGNTLYLNGEYSNGNREEWTLDCSNTSRAYKLDGWSYNYNKDKSFSIVVSGS